jgi:acetyl-CoA hydrolase
LAQAPGHDINYIGLSGALWYASPPGELPWTPPTLVGDLGGGALYLAVGLLAGLLRVRAGHEGQVVDAAIVDGSANLLNLLLSVRAFGQLTSERGRSPIDGAHWYATYRCSDGRAVTVGAIEPKFYEVLLQKLGLASELSVAAQYDPTGWAHGRALLTAVFATKTREEWCRLLQGSDCCFAPVLDIEEAAAHPHLRARGVFSNTDGMLQATPAPRFSAVPPRPPGPVPAKGEHGAEILAELGLDPAEIAALR